MADFLPAYWKTRGNEGDIKLNLDRNDPGNWTGGKAGVGNLVGTKFGLIWSDFKQVYGRIPTREEMDALTEDDAIKMYKVLYWDTIAGDSINVQHFAEEIYDTNVSTGGGSVPIIVGEALQTALKNKIGLDKATIDKLNSLANEKDIDGNNLA